MNRLRPAVALALGLTLIVACGTRRTPSDRVHPSAFTETGDASWYGRPFHGRRTANGEVYDMHRLTAAHPSLPFDTWVSVTNLGNGRSVRVRINDRGPFTGGRIIDLSHEAAKRIDMIEDGVVRVRVEVVASP